MDMLAQIPWNPVIWFLAATGIIGLLEFKGETFKQYDPENYPKRRISLLVYAIFIGTLNMIQIGARIELISFFNYLPTALLFVRFWFIEVGQKKRVARNMALLTLLLALLSLVADWGAAAEMGAAYESVLVSLSTLL